MTEHVMEIVRFKAKAGASTQTVIIAATKLETWLRKQSGFVQRRLCQSENGNWIDIVEWQDMSSAQAAAQAIMTTPDAAAFMGLIAMDSVDMTHAHITLAQ
ncbi:MAG: hypothetical protein ACRCWF_00235 [Beijerinckiaceae bacterium]